MASETQSGVALTRRGVLALGLSAAVVHARSGAHAQSGAVAPDRFEKLVAAYPDHSLAASAKASLDQLNLGLTDEELVTRSMGGDSDSFNQLILRWERPIYSLAYRVLGREEDARDVCQETFIRAFRGSPGW